MTFDLAAQDGAGTGVSGACPAGPRPRPSAAPPSAEKLVARAGLALEARHSCRGALPR